MIKKILIIMCMTLLVLPMISAFEFDNVKDVPDNFNMYSDKIEIKNTFLWLFPTGKVADVKLISNTEQALIKGQAVFELTLYEDYPDPISNVEFFNVNEDKLKNVYGIKWEWYDDSVYTVRVPIYDDNKNPDERKIIDYKDVEVASNQWKEYTGQEFKKGTYKFRLTASKPMGIKVDFIPEFFGVELPEFAWWDTNWKNKKAIYVNETSGAALTNYTLFMNVTYAEGMLDGFDDLRFVNGTEDTELDFWFEDGTIANTSSVVVAVEIPNLPANSKNNVIYVYYNNTAASYSGDISEIEYGYGDDFNRADSGTVGDDWVESAGDANITKATLYVHGFTGTKLWSATENYLPERIRWRMNRSATTTQIFGFAKETDAGASTKIWDINHDSATSFSQHNGAGLVKVSEIDVGGGWNTIELNNITYATNKANWMIGNSSTDGIILAQANMSYRNDEGDGINVTFFDQSGAYQSQYDYILALEEWATSDPLYAFGDAEASSYITPVQSFPIDGNVTENSLDIVFQCNYTSSGVNLENAILYVNVRGGASEYTSTGVIAGTADQENFTASLTNNRNYSWFCFGNSTDGSITGSTGNFSLNVSVPTLSLTTDLNTGDAFDTVNFTNSFSANSTVVAGQLVNATYYLWNSSHSLVSSSTQTVSGWNTTDSSNASLTADGIGTFTWNTLSCGINSTSTECALDTANQTFTIKAFTEGTNSYNITSIETEEQIFELNITIGSTINDLSANLIYNGTSYPSTDTCSGVKCTLYNNIDIPLVQPNTTTNQNMSFYWEIILFSSESETPVYDNSTFFQQNVSNLIFEMCNSTKNPHIVNYTIYDETNNTMYLNATFDAMFNYYLGNGSVKRTNHTSPTVQNQTFSFCTNTNKTVRVDSQIELSKEGYASRRYDFIRENYYNLTTIQKLFLLGSGEASNIRIEAKDQGLIPVANYLIKIFRFFPDQGYVLIGSQITDEFGQILEKLVENDVRYRFEFYDTNKNLKKSTEDIRIICRSAYCVVPFIIEETQEYFEDFTNLTDYSYSLTFDNNTNRFSFSWDDKTEDISTHRLEVKRYLMNGTTLACNSSLTVPVGIITCAVGDVKASYSAQGFRIVSGVERRIALLNAKVGDVAADTFGLEGLFWVFILLFTLIAVGSFHPVIGVVLYLIGFIIMGTIGVISFSIPLLIGNLVIGIIFIWAFRS